MKRVAFFTSLYFATTLFPQTTPQPRILLAVTAHPDDEAFMGPILARYAREGVKVYLAIATKGEKGANEFAKIPAGDALADARRAEATCACKELGIESPIFFNLNDGELGALTEPLAKNIHAVAYNVEKLVDQLHPQVILTWGPEGGYGHPDHRLVSDAVTQVVQSLHSSIKLYSSYTIRASPPPKPSLSTPSGPLRSRFTPPIPPTSPLPSPTRRKILRLSNAPSSATNPNTLPKRLRRSRKPWTRAGTAPFPSVTGTPPALRPIFSNELLTSDASPFVRFSPGWQSSSCRTEFLHHGLRDEAHQNQRRGKFLSDCT